MGQTMRDRTSIDEQARRYLVFLRASDQPVNLSPWEELQTLIEREPDHAWSIICNAVELSAEDEDLALIGAGPLEQLLVRHAEFLERALSVAATSAKFTRALHATDVRGGHSDAERLERFLRQRRPR